MVGVLLLAAELRDEVTRGDTAERAVAPRAIEGAGVGEAEGGLRGAVGFGETVVIYRPLVNVVVEKVKRCR